MTELLPNAMAVQVPEGAELINIYTHEGKNELTYWHGEDGKEWADGIFLPPGDWYIVGLWPGCREEQAAEVVEGRKEYGKIWLYKNYINGKAEDKAHNSLASLIRSKGLDTTNHYVILKKKQ